MLIGQRYHPAVVARAAATLGEMFPERFWLALGTGEASNEHITGGDHRPMYLQVHLSWAVDEEAMAVPALIGHGDVPDPGGVR